MKVCLRSTCSLTLSKKRRAVSKKVAKKKQRKNNFDREIESSTEEVTSPLKVTSPLMSDIVQINIEDNSIIYIEDNSLVNIEDNTFNIENNNTINVEDNSYTSSQIVDESRSDNKRKREEFEVIMEASNDVFEFEDKKLDQRRKKRNENVRITQQAERVKKIGEHDTNPMIIESDDEKETEAPPLGT